MRGARVVNFAIGIVVIAAFLNGLLLWQAAAEDFSSLDGTWEGDLKSIDLTGEGKATTSWRRIIIQDGQARVFYKRDEKINEVKPGKFRVERQLTNAVIVAIDSGHDNEGTWVETWAFAVTQKDKNTLITNFMRQVNNINLPLSVSYSKFSAVATGELSRK